MEQKQGLKNFAVNIKPTMLKIKTNVDEGQGRATKLDYHEQYIILQFYLEVIDYLNKESR